LISFNEHADISIGNAEMLEIGTGWYPIVPIAFILSGVNIIETTDIKRLYNIDSINKTLQAIIKLHDNNKLRNILPNYQEDRIAILRSALKENKLSGKLRLLQMKSTICKCSNLTIKSNSKDFIVSNHTLQFIKQKELALFFSELTRIGRTNSIISLLIDLTDEFSYFDSTISQFNFLKFSDLKWKMISSPSYSPNRLRYTDYKNYFPANLRIIKEEIVRANENELINQKIHKSFSHYNIADLLVKEMRFIAVPVK